MLNEICPDNFKEIERKLREFLFVKAKLLNEPGFDQEKATNLKIDRDKSIFVFKTILKLA